MKFLEWCDVSVATIKPFDFGADPNHDPVQKILAVEG